MQSEILKISIARPGLEHPGALAAARTAPAEEAAEASPTGSAVPPAHACSESP